MLLPGEVQALSLSLVYVRITVGACSGIADVSG